MAEETKRIAWKKTSNAKIKNRDGWYWARFSTNGHRIQESLDTQSFEIAKRLVEEMESCIKLGVDWRKEHELFETAWPDFLDDKAKGIKTRKARESTLNEYIMMGDKHFMPFFKDCRVSDINEEKWEEYVEWMKAESNVEVFANHRSYLMGFLSWALKKGKIRTKPELYKPDSTDKETIGKCYTEVELAILRQHSEMPLQLAICMAQFMGMRSSEITQLHKSRFDKDRNIITLKKEDTKIGRGRQVPVHRDVKDLINEQWRASGDSPYLFPNRVDNSRPMDTSGFKKPWAALKKQFDIEGRFHDLKHTFITMALRSGMNPVVVSKIVGTSINVIENTYLHLGPKDLFTDIQKLSLDL